MFKRQTWRLDPIKVSVRLELGDQEHTEHWKKTERHQETVNTQGLTVQGKMPGFILRTMGAH